MAYISVFAKSFLLPAKTGTGLQSVRLSQCTVPKFRRSFQTHAVQMAVNRTIPEKITVAGYDIFGVSVAAVESCVWIPSLSLAFDSGRCPSGVVNMRFMAITHGHCDHVHGLPLHLATRNLQRLPKPIYFVPPAIEDDIRGLVKAVGKLENCNMDMESVALTPGGEGVEFKKGWIIKSFPTKHSVPSQGYVLLRKKKKLKKEFIGKCGEELARLKKEGVEIETIITTPEIAYTGDTRIEAIAESEVCRAARILITELTFIDDSSSAEQAARFGHIHLDDILAREEIFRNNEAVVFTHFSARYSEEGILQALSRLPKGLREKSVALGAGLSCRLDK